jgi:hypothetical protein
MYGEAKASLPRVEPKLLYIYKSITIILANLKSFNVINLPKKRKYYGKTHDFK